MRKSHYSLQLLARDSHSLHEEFRTFPGKKMRSRNACNADDVACVACTQDAMRCMINFNIFVKNPLDCDVGLLTSAQSCSKLSRKCVFFHMRKLLKSSVDCCVLSLCTISLKSRKSFSPRLDGFFLCCVCKVAKNKN